jgi:hypothetical protein
MGRYRFLHPAHPGLGGIHLRARGGQPMRRKPMARPGVFHFASLVMGCRVIHAIKADVAEATTDFRQALADGEQL